MYAGMENINHCIESINCDLQKVGDWTKANGLLINFFRSKYLLLSRKRRAFVMPDIIHRDNKVDFVQTATNLGIIFKGRLM